MGIDHALLGRLGEEAKARGYDAETLLDTILREAFEMDYVI